MATNRSDVHDNTVYSHTGYRTVSAAGEYIEEQTGGSVEDGQCPLRVVEIVEVEDGSTTE